MTEYEYMILLSTLREEAAIHGEHIVTAISAYVLVVFFASNKLPVLFTCTLTLVYSFFLTVPVLSNYESAAEALKVGTRYIQDYPDGFLALGVAENSPTYIVVLYFTAWLLSVSFAVYRFRSGRSV